MKTQIRKALILFVAATMLLATLAGCSPSAAPEAPEAPADAPSQEPAAEPVRVALLLSGPITDQGWNASAYNGLMQIESDWGAEVAYSESVSQSDMEEVFRGYAESGFDVIFGHGFEFQDAALKVAEQYPETIFMLTSNTYFADPNVGSVSDDGVMKGFLGGIVAAVISESGTVGFIGGMEIPPIRKGMNGFEAGAKYANPDITVLTSFIGNFEDAGAAKEIALAMIDQGADVVMAQADSASLGAIEAVVERDIYGIGINGDQNSLAPDNIVTSAVANFPKAMSIMVGRIVDGSWVPSSNVMGLKEGVVDLAPYHGLESELTGEQKERIEQLKQEILDGKADSALAAAEPQ